MSRDKADQPEAPRRLVDYPYVVVRISCRFCRRRNTYRLARLAARCGPDMDLERVLDLLACPAGRPAKLRKMAAFCGIYYSDLWLLERQRPPADLPDMGRR